MYWTKKEIKLLIKNYKDKPKNKLLKLFKNRNWKSLTNKARKIGIRKKGKYFSKLEKLLENIPEAYYRIGFIFAEGKK